MAFRRQLVPITAERPPRAARPPVHVRVRSREDAAPGELAEVREAPVSWIGVAIVMTFTALISAVAADARWLVALGRTIVAQGSIPDGVPFAAASTKGWPNVPVLAELVFDGLYSLAGARGLQIAQIAAVTIACALIALDARRLGAGDRSIVIVLVLAVPAAFAAIVAIRAQLFSLALFPALVVVLRAEARRPSRLIWAIPPLLALWSNLHGASLTGLAVAGAYLVFDRARREPLVAFGVLASSCLALCLTPALQDTPAYYAGVVGGEAARQGIGLWAPFSLSSGPDVATLACLALGLWPLIRARPRLWEAIALAGLVVLAARTSRGGVWVVLMAAPLIAAGLPWRSFTRSRVVPLVLGTCAILTVFGIVRGPFNTAATPSVVERAVHDAHGTPVLAADALAEQIALAGGRVWVANPVDAFSRSDQKLWLAWLEGAPAGDAALAHAPRVVVVGRNGAPAQRLAADPRFRLDVQDKAASVYIRR
ncbi:MAG TPA: hypothetical protein VGF46_13355 [Gaiellales bacterium]